MIHHSAQAPIKREFVPTMEEWLRRHPQQSGRLPACGRHRAGVASRLSHYVSQAFRPLIAWRGRR